MSYDHSMYAPTPAVDEFSQIIAQLPPALRNIEPQLLQILVQDEGHIAFILNPMTGEVDPTKLDILRHQLLGSGSVNSQAYSSSASSSMGGMYQHRSSSSSNMYANSTNGGGNVNMPMRGGQAPGQGLSLSDRYGGGVPMGGYDRGGRDHDSNNWEMGNNQRDRERGERDRPDQRDNRGGDTSRGDNRLGDRERASEREREQRERGERETRDRERERDKDSRLAAGHGTKASTPCKFFNTRPGCRFGDLCPFGHFKGDDSGGGSGGGGASAYGPSARGGPTIRGRGGGRR